VETAGQMLDFIRQAHGFYANLRDVEPKVVLVHSREELLGEIGADLGSYARTVLGKRGVDVRLGCESRPSPPRECCWRTVLPSTPTRSSPQ